MSKPVLGLILGAVLGVVDGLTSLFYPEAVPQIFSILAFSGLKGLIAGLIIGVFATRVHSLTKGVIFGAVVGLVLAFIIAAMPDESGKHYYVEIMLPGTIVGFLLGFATQKYGRRGVAKVA